MLAPSHMRAGETETDARVIHLDAGWIVWCDVEAPWKDDTLFLPDADHRYDLDRIPRTPPTGGWQGLYQRSGKEPWTVVTDLPSTVEEHFWGAIQSRPYTQQEYRQWVRRNGKKVPGIDKEVVNGAYHGVSWWYKTFSMPKAWQGKRIVLTIPAARLRAEVYVNQKLAAYELIAELPFEADISPHVRWDRANHLAVRITNPGGSMTWADNRPVAWGAYRIPASHGFGGLDQGIRIQAKSSMVIEDIYIHNHPDLKRITAEITIGKHAGGAARGRLVLSVRDKADRRNPVWTRTIHGIAIQRHTSTCSYPIVVDQAMPWHPAHPRLYVLDATLEDEAGGVLDHASQHFGFRWFEARGIGGDARFFLNGEPITLFSAISWGFWPFNGLWPTQEYAHRDAEAARTLGLNMISFHRNLGSALSLRAHDEMGLLTHAEPGGGHFAWSEDRFARTYMREKIRRMVLRDRSAPSLIMYNIQNEYNFFKRDGDGQGPTFWSPSVKDSLDLVKALDDTRIITLHSGVQARAQAYYLPGDSTYYHDDGSGWSGWHDIHDNRSPHGGGGVYRDGLYSTPDAFALRDNLPDQIKINGETLCGAGPDDLQAIGSYFRRHPAARAFHKRDHMEMLRTFEAFLHRASRFTEDYPDIRAITAGVADRNNFWRGRMIENSRIARSHDGIAINGWESLPIENHSGMVDLMRNIKGHPEILSHYLQPAYLAIKAPHLVLLAGDPPEMDVCLLNDAGVHGEGTLSMELRRDNHPFFAFPQRPLDIRGRPVQWLIRHCIGPRLPLPGHYEIRARLRMRDGTVLTGREPLFILPSYDTPDRTIKLYTDCEDTKVLSFLEGMHKIHVTRTWTPRVDVSLHTRGAPSKDALRERLAWMRRDRHRLIIWPESEESCEQWLQVLQTNDLLRHHGRLGAMITPWMGSWNLAARHPLLYGLAAGKVLDWEWQPNLRAMDGIVLADDEARASTVVAYHRDHKRSLGASLLHIPIDRGDIIVCTLGGLRLPEADAADLHPLVMHRLLYNLVTIGTAMQ